MRIGLGLCIAAIFMALGALHLFWLAGGRWGGDAVIPHVPGKGPAIAPSGLATLVVALLLMTASAVVLARVGALRTGVVPAGVVRGAAWAIAAAFGLRVIGDFRLVGLFKRIRGTSFARWDTRLFVPLCAFLSAGTAWLAASESSVTG